MRLFPLTILILLVYGCDKQAHEALEKIAGHKTDVVVLAEEPFVLDKSGKVLQPQDEMKVVGGMSLVCFVLKGGVESGPNESMNKLFEEAMHEAVVTVDIKLTTGEKYSLSKPMQAWRRYGRILKSEELSACGSIGSELKIGSEVSEVQIVSSEPLKVQGVYWESSNSFDRSN